MTAAVRERFVNSTWSTKLNGAIDADDASMVVDSVVGLESSGQIRLKIGPGDTAERVLATLNGTTTLAITRGVDGYTATSHADDEAVVAVFTAGAQESFGDYLEDRGVQVLAKGVSVDLNSGTAQTLYTVPATRNGGTAVSGCVVTHLVVRSPSVSLTTATFSVGWNNPAYNDVLPDSLHTELTGATVYSVCFPSPYGAVLGAVAGVLKLLANTLQGGAATATVDVLGYLY